MEQCDRLIEKITITFLCFFIIIYSGSLSCVFAQDRPIEFPSSPNPVGSGARALGMGGAFIAVADDATAASWNPGGLIQLRKPEFSIVGASLHRIEDNTFGRHPEGNGEQTVSEDIHLNYFSAAYPFPCLNQNMILSVNYQHLFDFKREWNFSTLRSSLTHDFREEYDYALDGGLSAFGIAWCMQPRAIPQISLGVTVNFWEDGLEENEWNARLTERQTKTSKKTGQSNTIEVHKSDRYAFSGINANIGFLWDVTGKLKIGGVLKTPFEADLDYEYVRPKGSAYVTGHSKSGKMKMPMAYGIGAAYRFSDEFTASLDIYRTEWDDFVFRNSGGEDISPITGELAKDSDIDPTCQVRMGMEYLFIDRLTSKSIVPLCLGLFYDPAPAEGEPDDFFGFSIGSGFSDGEHFTFDIAYQYRFGNNVGDSILKEWGFSQDIREHTLYSSLIIYF